jgi:hypothetical protein
MPPVRGKRRARFFQAHLSVANEARQDSFELVLHFSSPAVRRISNSGQRLCAAVGRAPQRRNESGNIFRERVVAIILDYQQPTAQPTEAIAM